MAKKIIRTDKWFLQANSVQKEHLNRTVDIYRQYCRALSFVVMNNWASLQHTDSMNQAIEALIHATKDNPSPRHKYFDKRFPKLPSYLRRAAIAFVVGQVSSFLTRYDQWQTSVSRKHRKAKPPTFNAQAGCYPVLYVSRRIKLSEEVIAKRNEDRKDKALSKKPTDEKITAGCVAFDSAFRSASIKVFNGSDWVWLNVAIKGQRKRHLTGIAQAPQLIVNNDNCHLSVPFQLTIQPHFSDRVCSVDIGINTLATASIVDDKGTVHARAFFHPAKNIDRRDQQAAIIRSKAKLTQKLSKGFCKDQYRIAANLNNQIAHSVSSELVAFAKRFGASAIVFEHLKGWRPKAGKKGSSLKQRFHGWLHRKLALLTEEKAAEQGLNIRYVYARGTSSQAFDGSGDVKRDASQYELATFTSGKRYNADLNASYNIAARYWAKKNKLFGGNDQQVAKGKSSCATPRTSVTLSCLWSKDRSKGADATNLAEG